MKTAQEITQYPTVTSFSAKYSPQRNEESKLKNLKNHLTRKNVKRAKINLFLKQLIVVFPF